MTTLKSGEIFTIADKFNACGINKQKMIEAEQRLAIRIADEIAELNKLPGLKVTKINVRIIDVSSIKGYDTAFGGVEIEYTV